MSAAGPPLCSGPPPPRLCSQDAARGPVCGRTSVWSHHLNLLAGLASQADLVVFPVDCISHHAAQLAKQLCRQAGKRFIPLRSASVISLLAALQRPEVTGLAGAAD